MSTKRKNEAGQGHARKRQRMQTARNIDVQRSNITATSLNVDDFVKSRGFEIDALEKAMKTAKRVFRQAGAQRVFQTLPRELRRRAASHNARKLPLRFSQKAAQEIAADGIKAPQPRKLRDLPRLKKLHRTKKSRKTLLEERSKKNHWQETHLWHAKRMKMDKKWNHTIAITSNQKAFRPSYRASKHGVSLYDSSYTVWLKASLDPRVDSLHPFFSKIFNKNDKRMGARRILHGSVSTTLIMYEHGKQPQNPIGPVRLLPLGGGVLLIGCHPSIVEEVKTALRLQTQNLCEWDSTQLNTFEVLGPQAGELLAAAFKGANNASERILDQLGQGSALPGSCVVKLEIQDPRITFPPKPRAVKTTLRTIPHSILQDMTSISSNASQSNILEAGPPSQSKSAIDSRRAKQNNKHPNLSRLDMTPEDDQVPIVIIRRDPSEEPLGGAVCDGNPLEGYTVIVPQHWAMPAWASLTYSSPRVLGLTEWRHQHLEAGLPYFPDDWMTTKAGQQESCLFVRQTLRNHHKRPPAKRPNLYTAGSSDKSQQTLFYGGWERIPHGPNMLAAGTDAGTFADKLVEYHSTGKRHPADFAYLLREKPTRPAVSSATHALNSQATDRGLTELGFFAAKLVAVRGKIEPGALLFSWDPTQPCAIDVLDDKDRVPSGIKFIPGAHVLMGFVSSANFSMSTGCCIGIGTIGVEILVNRLAPGRSPDDSGRMICHYKNLTEDKLFEAKLELLF